MSQLSFFNEKKVFEYTLGNNVDVTPVKVSFRELVLEITNTTYLTHSIYYYPAKFIPQVVKFCIDEFTNTGDWILDPFAGSGTVGLEAYINERNSILLDINYLLKHIIPTKIYTEKTSFDKNGLLEKLNSIKKCNQKFVPEYSNIRYWYPDEIFEIISKYWAGLHNSPNDIYKQIIQASLVKVSKQFSWAEHRTPKLFKSKFKKRFITELLETNWKNELDRKIYDYSVKYYTSIKQFQKQTQNNTQKVEYFASVDSSKFKVEKKKIDAIITSPPYMQAQEYKRTSKLDLFWLGYTEKEIREISKLEIPYRKAERIIRTETLDNIRKQITNTKLLKILNSYFDHTIASLENNMNILKTNGKACIFVGNPKIDGIEIETWKFLQNILPIKTLNLK